jgi:hypothetical protein
VYGDHGYSAGEGNHDQYQAAYRDAYSNGYRHGYYGDADFSSSTVTAPRGNLGGLHTAQADSKIESACLVLDGATAECNHKWA